MEGESEDVLLLGSFSFKKMPDGSKDKNIVICNICAAEFKYHRSTTSLSYHLRAKHARAETDKPSDCAVKEEEGREMLPGSFSFKRSPDGSDDKGVVICNLCAAEFEYGRNITSLTCHLETKHAGGEADRSKDGAIKEEGGDTLLLGSFSFADFPDCAEDKNIVISDICAAELKCDWSAPSLSCHLETARAAAGTETDRPGDGVLRGENSEETLLLGSFRFKKLPDGSDDKGVVVCNICDAEFKYRRSTTSLSYHLKARHTPAETDSSRGRRGKETILRGSFSFKKLPDGSKDKSIVICNICAAEFKYHRSTTSLSYHLKAKHAGGEADRSSGNVRWERRGKERLVRVSYHFKRLPDGTEDKNIAICNICAAEFKYPRSIASLYYHLKVKHAGAESGRSSDSAWQGTIHEYMTSQPVSCAKAEALADAISRWIACDCRPLSIVEDEGFLNTIRLASSDVTYTLPSRETIASRIEDLYANQKSSKLEQLRNAKAVALTGDRWASVTNHDYLSVSAHFIDSSWALNSFPLGVMLVDESFAEGCAKKISDITSQWEITGKISTVGNMGASAGLIPYEHMPCIAHSMQCSIVTALRDCGVQSVLEKCRKLVGHFKRSLANAADLRRQQGEMGQREETLVPDAPGRWSSTLSMITQLLRNKNALQATTAARENAAEMLTDGEFDKIEVLKKLLEPCKYVADLLGGEWYVSCSVVLPALCHLLHVMKVSDDDPYYVIRFKGSFTADLSRTKDTLNLPWLKVATALDPRFKDLKCLPRSERDEVWVSIRERLQKTILQTPPPKRKRYLLVYGSDSEDDADEAAGTSLDRYRAEPIIQMEDCPLQWWAKHSGAYEDLSHLAQKYLASPASAVPSETLFSLSGQTLQEKRAVLDSESVDRFVCLSNWLSEKKSLVSLIFGKV
ncbi:E3 SUMO-protein ligase ZBED1-like [Paramormyrops kingsleyae]|uniref:Zinc finger BED domain-containing protein 1-like n=1 Tax=Paramormyrops kingsleyae TaxID=1676925 RepID=A0A3B3R6V0_9TELE|nr:zinc finger BED domain-containing protein 1-like [Paramormyrops kingsleyae]